MMNAVTVAEKRPACALGISSWLHEGGKEKVPTNIRIPSMSLFQPSTIALSHFEASEL
jgi:hypothetical protein